MRTISKRAFGMAILVFAAACNENGGDSLNLAEKQALSTAISNSGALVTTGTPAAAYGGFAVFMLPNIGTLSANTSAALNSALSASISGLRAASYDGAVGVQIVFTDNADASYTFTGVIGWAGLNVANNTVDEVVASGASTQTSTPVGNGAHTINGTTAYGVYWQRTPQASFGPGTSGTFNLTNSSFTGTEVNCTSIVTQITSCTYRTGTMSGNFAFAAQQQGTANTYNQTSVAFASIPAVRLVVVE